MSSKIIRYNPKLKKIARHLRKNMTYGEVLLWNELKGDKFGYDFHRQKPIGNYIVDFFCKELMLAIEIDGELHLERQKDDEIRQKEIEKLGISFLRFSSMDVIENLSGICESIYKWIDEHNK